MEDDHKRFTVSGTAYLRSLSREDLRAECIAVHYQDPPTKTGRGVSRSLRFPVLIVAGYIEQPREMAEKVARILEQHWHDDDTEGDDNA